MDDINFGADSIAQAREILGKRESALNTIGLRLNTGKTKVLPAQEAVRHFWVQENRELTILENLIANGATSHPSLPGVQSHLRKRYSRFRRSKRVGHWDKVYKRYFTIFGKLHSTHLERHVPDLLRHVPPLREPIFRYYLQLGFSRKRFRQIEHYVTSGENTDDASRFAALHLLVQWHLPRSGNMRAFAVGLASAIGTARGATVAGVIAGLCVMAKYATSGELQAYIENTHGVWTKSEWAGRQVAAVIPRLEPPVADFVRGELSVNGLLEGLRVASHLQELQELLALDVQLRQYLFFTPGPKHPYPFEKVLIATAMLRGRLNLPEKREIIGKVSTLSGDHVVGKLLREFAPR